MYAALFSHFLPSIPSKKLWNYAKFTFPIYLLWKFEEKNKIKKKQIKISKIMKFEKTISGKDLKGMLPLPCYKEKVWSIINFKGNHRRCSFLWFKHFTILWKPDKISRGIACNNISITHNRHRSRLSLQIKLVEDSFISQLVFQDAIVLP